MSGEVWRADGRAGSWPHPRTRAPLGRAEVPGQPDPRTALTSEASPPPLQRAGRTGVCRVLSSFLSM